MCSSEPPSRRRACAAVLRRRPGDGAGTEAGDRAGDLEILMVQYRTWWTLPGGGVEAGESGPQAAARELWEETRLRGQAVRWLFREQARRAGEGVGDCYLVDVEPGEAELGYDPELPLDDQHLFAVAWFPLSEKRDDHQVSKVIAVLGLEV